MSRLQYSDALIKNILDRVKTIAVVGASPNSIRPSYFVVKYMIDKGYEVFPINPGHAGKEMCGVKIYGSLDDLPVKPDMVDIFRNSEAAGQIVDTILSADWPPDVIWMQLSVIHEEAAQRATEKGITVIMDRCPKIEYGRLSGEIGWTGFNSRTLSSKRPKLNKGFQHFGLRGK